ncbi:hypothetical protein FIV06_30145 (plasmid) [Labrenzia sp. THAF191b]|uniref:hypothetical protein n=1 Tax=unclassified Labrenzia TaxID=2648686 RepID=UPI0012690235|nr:MULTISPECIES: hypothetical protein [unclassified Labrenzia]QFT01732.1 hypothetical protein FIV06_30145 [Labrenzia sp. THAF191b]QFT07937.1 hypothetical protein FIV05_29595 [Labrenzia sp. THAF191a]QFT19698.1 hypothetical protein FIV03_30700 [Labrenzia sp. THAF187b]
MRGLLLLLVGLATYAAMLIVSQWVIAGGIESKPAGILIALSPMLPAAFICGVIIRSIRRLDEMQRKLQFEALALSFAGTALITFGYGFLEGAGFPKLSMFAVWPLMAAIWFVGVMIGRLRFK